MAVLRDDGWTDLGECKWGPVRSPAAVVRELEEKIRDYPNRRDAYDRPPDFHAAGAASRSRLVSGGAVAWAGGSVQVGRIAGPSLAGYTPSMKTAVSIPDDVFEEAEHLAVELQTSRSQLYSRALQEFVARHASDRVTEAMNRVIAEVGSEVDEFSQRASRRALEQVEW